MEYGPTTEPDAKAKFIPFELHISNASTLDIGWYTCGVDFKIDVVKANIFFNLKAETPRGKFVSSDVAFVPSDFILLIVLNKDHVNIIYE